MLSALSKETGFLFLPALVLFNALVRPHYQPQLATKKLYGTVVAVAVAYASVRILASGAAVVQSHHAPMELAPFAIRLLNMPAVVFYYLKNFLLPWPLGIAQHWIYREVTFEGFLLPLLGIAAFMAFAFLTLRRFGAAAMFFLTWWVIGIGLHVHLVPLDSTVADRWHYMPSLGLIGLLVFWIQADLPRPDVRSYAAALAIFFIVGFGLRTYIRNEDWTNEEELLSRDLLFQPESFAIMSQLGFIHLDQKRYTEACPMLEKSVAIAPNWTVNTNNLGVCYYYTRRFAEAEAHFRKSIKNGRYHLAYENLARMLIEQKRYAEARELIETALRILPHNFVLSGLLVTARDASN